MFWGSQHTEQSAQVKQTQWRNKKVAAIAAGALLSLFVALSTPVATFAATACKNNTCVIACNRSIRTCGLFPRNLYAAGYSPAPYIPLGYKRVRLTKCDRMVCPTGRSCNSPVPIGNKDER